MVGRLLSILPNSLTQRVIIGCSDSQERIIGQPLTKYVRFRNIEPWQRTTIFDLGTGDFEIMLVDLLHIPGDTGLVGVSEGRSCWSLVFKEPTATGIHMPEVRRDDDGRFQGRSIPPHLHPCMCHHMRKKTWKDAKQSPTGFFCQWLRARRSCNSKQVNGGYLPTRRIWKSQSRSRRTLSPRSKTVPTSWSIASLSWGG